MESGFGWHYPPGTPGPYSEQMRVECPSCETEVAISYTVELGAGFVEPEECPACGEPFPTDILDRAEADEGPDPDDLREQQFEAQMQDEEDRRDERNENYPEDIPH